MKKYLIVLTILIAFGLLATYAYADWARSSESSSRDIEVTGDIQQEALQAKKLGDVRLLQLTADAQKLANTQNNTTGTLTLNSDTLITINNNNSGSDNGNAEILAAATTKLLAREDDGGIGAAGSAGDDGAGDDGAGDDGSGIIIPLGSLGGGKDIPDIEDPDNGDDTPVIPGGEPQITDPPIAREAVLLDDAR